MDVFFFVRFLLPPRTHRTDSLVPYSTLHRTLTISETGVPPRMMRSSTCDVLRLDDVTHARARGLSDRTVLTRHVFPNAFASTLTLGGLTLGRLFGGIA